MTWTPRRSEAEPAEMALRDAVRATVMPYSFMRSVSVGADGHLLVQRIDGQRLKADLRIVADVATDREGRAARRVEVAGQAVTEDYGVSLKAVVLVDVATQAFLAVDMEIFGRTRMAAAR